MKRIRFFMLALAICACACTRDFIADKAFMTVVEEDFDSRSEIIDRAGINLDAMGLSKDERQAMEFMYAYMPLGDIVNMSPEYFLNHYHLTLKALDEFPWGKIVPERELRHFVLPVRVNNENLDDSREVFFQELAPRLKGLSMYDAVLEVNHWCHEKAVYMPSDRRTSSPLATVKTAYGRCGEESTLLVAALRSVAIPARQVYTPRWAHTDSNHAWVEAWVDGQWHFLGACEPEPVLDLGWFNAPASRGMLMHTKVFGKYDGPEDVVWTSPNYTEINVIENYAPESASILVKVLDKEGKPVEGAKVEYKIYNYSNFETVATKSSDSEGCSSLVAGLGDMMIHVSKDGHFGFAKVSYGKDKEVEIVLQYTKGSEIPRLEMNVVPPVENVKLPDVTEEQRKANSCRLAYEDSLRNAYVATFYDKSRAEAFAKRCSLDPEATTAVLIASRGNYQEIESFLIEAVEKGRGERAIALLQSIAQKDLRDTPKYILDDHLYNTDEAADIDKVLCPRVETELLSAYRAYLQKSVPESLADSVRMDPALLVDWCNRHLTLHDEMSLRYVQLLPNRVWDSRLADSYSRDIFFVAMCRSFGVSAWRDTVTGVVKYEKGGLVYDVDFDSEQQEVAPTGKLQLRLKSIPLLDDPKYKTHFTISKFDDGTFVLQNYGGSWASLFKQPRDMDCGYYMITSGTRMSAGNVCANVAFFTIEEGKTTVADLLMRDDVEQIRVIGSFDSESKYISMPAPGKASSEAPLEKSILSTTGRGYYALALVDYGTEPTNHAFMDISAVASELQAWGRPLLIIFASEDDYKKFRAEHYSLPSTVSYGIDKDGSIRSMIVKEMKINGEGSLPFILVADTFNRVVFFSQGYSIGLGEDLLKIAKAL